MADHISQKRILCLGDSNTYGYDPCSYREMRYSENIRWTGQLKRAGWEILNYGQNGMSIPTGSAILQAMENLVSSVQPVDVITVMLGSNDLLQSPDICAESVAKRIKTLLTHLQKAAESAQILLISPPPMRLGTWVSEERLCAESARLGECYRAAAKGLHIHFADASSWDISLTSDGVHMDEAGHSAFAEHLKIHLKELTEKL